MLRNNLLHKFLFKKCFEIVIENKKNIRFKFNVNLFLIQKAKRGISKN